MWLTPNKAATDLTVHLVAQTPLADTSVTMSPKKVLLDRKQEVRITLKPGASLGKNSLAMNFVSESDKGSVTVGTLNLVYVTTPSGIVFWIKRLIIPFLLVIYLLWRFKPQIVTGELVLESSEKGNVFVHNQQIEPGDKIELDNMKKKTISVGLTKDCDIILVPEGQEPKQGNEWIFILSKKDRIFLSKYKTGGEFVRIQRSIDAESAEPVGAGKKEQLEHGNKIILDNFIFIYNVTN